MRTKLKKLLRSTPWWLVTPLLAVIGLLAYDASVRSSLQEAEAAAGVGPRQNWRIMEVGPDGVYGRIDAVRPAGRAMSVQSEETHPGPRGRTDILRLFQDASPDDSPWLQDLPGSTQDAWWRLYDRIEAHDSNVIFRKDEISDTERAYEVLSKDRQVLGRVVLERKDGQWQPVGAESPSPK